MITFGVTEALLVISLFVSLYCVYRINMLFDAVGELQDLWEDHVRVHKKISLALSGLIVHTEYDDRKIHESDTNRYE